MTCNGGPSNAICENISSNLPTFDPKGPECATVNVTQAGSGYESCPQAMNLGQSLSKSTGYSAPFPLLGSTDINNPRGRESEVGFLVGGDYYAPLAAEIEGNIVVLGDFINGAKGLQALGT